MTPQEANAVFFHLSGTMDVFKPPPLGKRLLAEIVLKRLIMQSSVIIVRVPENVSRVEYGQSLGAKEEDYRDVSQGGVWLYRRGAPSDYFTLVLDGRIEIRAGSQEFVSELGPWSTLCPDTFDNLPVDLDLVTRIQQSFVASAGTASDSPLTVANEFPRRLGSSRSNSEREEDTRLLAGSPIPSSGADLPLLRAYVPDFSARCISNSRILRINRQTYLAALYGQLPPVQQVGSPRPSAVAPSPAVASKQQSLILAPSSGAALTSKGGSFVGLARTLASANVSTGASAGTGSVAVALPNRTASTPAYLRHRATSRSDNLELPFRSSAGQSTLSAGTVSASASSSSSNSSSGPVSELSTLRQIARTADSAVDAAIELDIHDATHDPR